MNLDRQEEQEQVRAEAEAFLEPVHTLLSIWQGRLAADYIELSHQLLVAPYPFDAPENPMKAGLVVSLKGKEVRNGGSMYALDNYIPDGLDWLAAEIEFRIEEHVADPPFGPLWLGIRNKKFRLVRYDRKGDHEHCSCCCASIGPDMYSKAGELIDEANMAYVTEMPYEVWLCPRCFEYWAPLRNLKAVE